MATSEKPANPLPEEGDHDRVVMLSLRVDGSPDQHNPEVIGDKDAAVAAAREQFAQQAVSAAEQDRIQAEAADEGPGPDKVIDARKKEHDKVASAAGSRAEKVVGDLHKG